MAYIIAISGGIGSGKTLITNILRYMGYSVYDCDSNAKKIMDNSQTIKDYIKKNILSDAIINNKIERSVLANVVFKSKALLDKLNFIVHTEVKKDILSWISKYHEEDILFIETAILYQSGIDQLVDAVWEISAPKEIRIERVINRNKITREEVVARISSQNLESTYKKHPNTYRISNDNINSILSQIEKLLKF